MTMNSKNIYEKYWKDRLEADRLNQKKRFFPGEILESVNKILKSGERLLDLGCGEGNLFEITKHKFNEGHGCDISEIALKKAKKRGIYTICADLNVSSHLPYQNESFDAIICVEVLDYIFNPSHLLCETKRILRPNGQMILTTPNFRYFRNLAKLLLKGSFPHTTTDNFVWGGGHIHYFTTKDLSTLFRKAGFNKMVFHINHKQFERSWKRRIIFRLTGKSIFKEWFCGGIVLEAFKA